MEKANWNGKTYIAAEIAEAYKMESSIRLASKRGELKCPEPECTCPVLRYCHGEKKTTAYFAHRNNSACDYAEFDRVNTPIVKQVKRALYMSFSSRGMNVQIEAKLLPNHYTHLLLTMQNGTQIALELATQRTSVDQIETLSKKYKDMGIDLRWIVIDDDKRGAKENKTYFIKRYLLNENREKDVLILNSEGTEITQYVVDPNLYEHQGIKLYSLNYPDIYLETQPLSSLIFENGELLIEGFFSRYGIWLAKKKGAFERKIAQMEEEKREKEALRAEIEKMLSDDGQRRTTKAAFERRENTKNDSLKTTSTPSPSYETRRRSILRIIEDQTVQARDCIGIRWVRCECCGKIDTVDKFWRYGGINQNMGVCYACEKK